MLPIVPLLLVQLRQQALEEERLRREREDEEAKAQVFTASDYYTLLVLVIELPV